MRRAAGRALALLAVCCSTAACTTLRESLATGVGLAAKQVCSLVFVSRLESDRARELYVDPVLGGARRIVRTEVDPERGKVIASAPGGLRRYAMHRPGYGCTLVHDPDAQLEAPPEPSPASPAMAFDRRHRDAVFDVPALDIAIERAFQEDRDQPPLNTLAVVVLHDGKLVAERYADGIAPETRLPGWSLTKSVTATLVGVMIERGRLDVRAPGAIRAWRNTNDPRSRIALDHLLRMTSGLSIAETADRGDGRDPTSILLFHEADAAQYAATRPLAWSVGSHFEYMSGSTVLAMRAVQDAIGGGLREAHAFIHANLLGPLNMHGAVLEPDQAGTFVGSTHMLASARDWARFGQLYLDAGTAHGKRLVPADWLAYVTTATQPSLPSQRGDIFWESGRAAYGAGFWLFGDAYPALPPDSFDANGFQGQYLHIIPSAQLVVVRLGATHSRDYDFDRLPAEVVAAARNRSQ